MGKGLEKLLDGSDRVKTYRTLREAFIETVGPMTIEQIWNLFSQTPATIEFRNSLSVRGSADQMSNDLIGYIGRQPDSDTTDEVLRVIQLRQKEEIYPGSRQDLKLKKL